jgi:CRP-like cAMP-binding protein
VIRPNAFETKNDCTTRPIDLPRGMERTARKNIYIFGSGDEVGMLNPLPDHFQQSTRQAVPPFASQPHANATRFKATPKPVPVVAATPARPARMTTGATIPDATHVQAPRSTGGQDLVVAIGRAGRLGTQAALGDGGIFADAARLLVLATVSIRAWVTQRGHGTDDPLVTLVEGSKYRTVFNRISAAANLSSTERKIVEAISSSVRKTYQAGSAIVAEGEVMPQPMIIASGWACRRRTRSDGRSQVVGFLAPGDGIGLRGNAATTAPCTIMALTTVEMINATQLLRVAQQPGDNAGITDALLKAVAEDEEFLTNQIFRLGTTSPVERLAHLLLEMHARLGAAGLATDRDFFMPITYETLGEALALTPNVARRAMKQLKRMGLAKFRYGRVKLIAPGELQRMSNFTSPNMCVDRIGYRLSQS